MFDNNCHEACKWECAFWDVVDANYTDSEQIVATINADRMDAR